MGLFSFSKPKAYIIKIAIKKYGKESFHECTVMSKKPPKVRIKDTDPSYSSLGRIKIIVNGVTVAQYDKYGYDYARIIKIIEADAFYADLIIKKDDEI